MWSLTSSAEVCRRRNEGQLLRAIAQGRPGQAFNKGLTVVALSELCSNEQMAGTPETIFVWCVPHDLGPFPRASPTKLRNGA